MKTMHRCLIVPLLALLMFGPLARAAANDGVLPAGHDGKPLNLDFEAGDLRDWKAEGNAFSGQPMRGDTVKPRRSDMRSQHQGDFWIGTFERGGDAVKGTLTSVPFKVTQPWSSFLVAGGNRPGIRVELVRADTKEVFFKVNGYESESLRPVVVNLEALKGKEIFIRLVDQDGGPWGHLNFDNFRFHAQRPKFDNELNAALVKAEEPPPADAIKFAGLSPEEAARDMTLPAGFKGILFAGEPDVRQPIAFTLDDRGRIWVAEAYTYPVRAAEGKGKDRILVLEDTNGDGKFDRRTVFMEGLNLVSGLEVGFGGVFIGAAPYLMYVPIADGDAPKPAGPAKILLDGWDYSRDTHETLNTFSWGPDGWLYGCHGVFCPSNVGRPGATEAQRQWVDAAVWRYHPVKGKFEVFSEGTSNPWGVDFDERGQCWIEACVIPHLWHMIQGGRYERQGGEHYAVGPEEIARNEASREKGSRKPLFPYYYEDIKTIGDHVHYAGNKGPHAGNGRSDAMGGGHAHAGLMVYLGDSWPGEYRGNLFMNNIHGARINMDIPEHSGSGFTGHHGKDFINFNDSWSQVLNMRYDQNGSVYIIDWYDKNQCHHNNVEGHDRTNGRIFKVVYNDQKWTPVDLQKESDARLVELQLSKNDWNVRHTRRILQERAQAGKLEAKTIPALAQMARKNSDGTRQLRAMWALHVTGGFTEALAKDLFKARDEYVRAWTVQLLCEDHQPSAAMLREFANLAKKDKSPVVRLYLYSALQRMATSARWDILQALNQHGEDAKDHNLPLMNWYASEAMVSTDYQRALNLAADSKLPKELTFTTRRTASLGSAQALAAVTKLLARINDAPRQREILRGLAAAFKGQRTVLMPEGWEPVETRLAASTDSDVRTLSQSLSLTFGSSRALGALRTILSDKGGDANSRRSALESLLGVRDAELPPVLARLVQEEALRAPAIRGLAGYDYAATPDAVLAVYPQLGSLEKRDALNTLASRASYAKPLLAAVEKNSVPVKDLSPDLIRQLRNLRNPDLDKSIAKVWGAFRESSADKKKEIEKYKRVYGAGGSTPGDASRGRAVFARLCQQCHALFDTGGKVGPDLTGSSRADIDYILQNMVDPNAVIPNDYRASTIDMKDGRVITGIVRAQDAKTLTVVTPNELLTLARTEVETQQQNDSSMMPEGLLTTLADQEIRDLIYYLSRPGQVPLPAGAKAN